MLTRGWMRVLRCSRRLTSRNRWNPKLRRHRCPAPTHRRPPQRRPDAAGASPRALDTLFNASVARMITPRAAASPSSDQLELLVTRVGDAVARIHRLPAIAVERILGFLNGGVLIPHVEHDRRRAAPSRRTDWTVTTGGALSMSNVVLSIAPDQRRRRRIRRRVGARARARRSGRSGPRSCPRPGSRPCRSRLSGFHAVSPSRRYCTS